MYQPAGTNQRMVWRRTNVNVAGVMVAGNCILCLVVFGIMVLVMGTFMMVISTAFEWKPTDPELFRDKPNIPRTIGKVFLSIGGIIFGVGLILLVIIIRKAKKEARNYQVPVPTGTAAVIISGTTTPGSNYAATQSYPSAGPAQPYPIQSGTQFQPYYNAGQGQGQAYPPGPGQGPTYPLGPGQGQAYPPGPGQAYPPTSGPGQPYPPVSGPAQPYPPGQGQPYPSTGGQQFPPADGNPEKNTNTTNLAYNPGFPSQAPPSGPPDAPPPYSELR